MYIGIDLHCHSTYSDGSLAVKDVLDLAKTNGCKFLALTDHDTVDGISEATNYANSIGLSFIPGVEISVTLPNQGLIHIVGLNVDHNNSLLNENLNILRNCRISRAEKIAAKLAKIGINNAFDGAMEFCQDPKALSRTHFAKFLVKNGYAKASRAFDKYLAPGKAAYVEQTWASLKDAVTWITASGGVAVIAHPARYKFTNTKLLRLIDEFKEYGGTGIEVVSSSHNHSDALRIAHIAQVSGLLASVGSDFHSLTSYNKRTQLGFNYPLPDNCPAIFAAIGIEADPSTYQIL